MKIVFAHDHQFCRDGAGRYYSDGQFPYRLWQRYLQVFDEIIVAGRVRPLRPQERWEQLDVSAGPGVRFAEIPSATTLRAKLVGSGQVRQALREVLQEADGLIARNSEIGLLAAAEAQKLRKPWAVEVVSSAFDAYWHHGSWRGKAYAPWAEYATKRWVGRAPYALYVTKGFLQQRYPCPGRIAACSDVQLPRAEESVLQERRKRIRGGAGRPVIGMIGSLTQAYKGLGTALAALRRLKQQGQAFEFRVLGGGDVSSWQSLAAREGVAAETVFCGTIPSGEVPAWLDAVDVYVQPSLTEGLPRALLEAMSRGCPALGSQVGGIPELLSLPCLHRPGDSAALAGLLQRSLQDRAWRMAAAVRNFRLAATYAPDQVEPVRRRFWEDFRRACARGERASV